jgi:hypothetical protein
MSMFEYTENNIFRIIIFLFFYNVEIMEFKVKYRIYSHISRKILDNFWQYFFQFDLYAGHKVVSQTFYFFEIFLHANISVTL